MSSAGPSYFIGVHGPAEPDNVAQWPSEYFSMMTAAGVNSVKVLTPGTSPAVISQLRQGGRFVIARVFYQFRQAEPPEIVAQKLTHELRPAYNAGIRWFEFLNEPNVHSDAAPEGMWLMWQNGARFVQFARAVIQQLRVAFPQARWGFPGLSPGGDIPGLRYDSNRFFNEALSAGLQTVFNFICMHVYWTGGTQGEIADAAANVAAVCRSFSYRPVAVTEFSNPSVNYTKAEKGNQYAMFYALCRRLPPNFLGAYSFLLGSSSGAFPFETWTPELAAAAGRWKDYFYSL